MSNTPSGALCLLAESMRMVSRPSDILLTVSAKRLVVSPNIGQFGPQVSASFRVNLSWASACVAANVVATASTAAARTERIFIALLTAGVVVMGCASEVAAFGVTGLSVQSGSQTQWLCYAAARIKTYV